ncbi:putative L-amino-acid oxidase YobN [Lineus longissimus]|uniref:putative L-amino-acid oxidase YobN n=1 Tax=Lineus longissimus TaxID=88925 RepID=UPI002B4CF060
MAEPPYMHLPFLHIVNDAKIRLQALKGEKIDPVQQDDVYKKFFMNIAQFGLDYEYKKMIGGSAVHHTKTKYAKEVLVLGAGASGLVAAYELAQAGHKVTLIERQERPGGRIKTIRTPFAEGLHVDVGAMRLPGDGSDAPGMPSHWLTDFYIKLFKIPCKPFFTSNEKCYFNLYGHTVRMEEWSKDKNYWCTKFWPGWDKHLTTEAKKEIKGLDELFQETMKPVTEELMNDHSEEGWKRWVKKWSVISLAEFLRSDQYPEVNPLMLRPWPEPAITGYTVSQYGKLLNASLVEVLRDLIGDWWHDPEHTPVDGMDTLPKAFVKPNLHGWNHDVHLDDNIHYGLEVNTVDHSEKNIVKVRARNTATGHTKEFCGDAVIVTFPLTILRQIKFHPSLTLDKQKAIADITYLASTKIALQCKTKFWQNEKYGIKGGHSITNLPVGQVFYSDYPGAKDDPNHRGLLLTYNWTQDGLILGSQPEKEAVASAVEQIKKIHPEIETEFEVGMSQSWYSDPTAQGCCAQLKPNEYNNNMAILFKPEHPVYLAGEAISWSNGWIQGALESGHRAAYQFYSYNELEALREHAGEGPEP